MWRLRRARTVRSPLPLFFFNTLKQKKELFAPLKPGVVSMYSCGPTVYGPQHIGNLRAALFSDTVARALLAEGYHVRRATNITDAGHMVGDGDEGEDKMAVGAKRDQMTPEEVAATYTRRYLDDLKALDIDIEHILFPRATEYIREMVAMIETLMQKGFAYRTSDGVYFDTSKLPDYGKLGGIAQVKLMGGARIAMEDGKRNLHDFVLWRKAKPNDLQQWDSPWGAGNPGWHIECSAMIRTLLGTQIDIHTGGMDHIPVHHNNEIAQTEAACGTLLARYWLHEAFVTIGGDKISKSLGNEILLSDIIDRGYHPLALRYFFLQAHYRTPVTFSWEALAASASALARLWREAREVIRAAKGKQKKSEASLRMQAILRDDLATPAAVALLFESFKNEDLSPAQMLGVISVADSVLGLSLLAPPEDDLPVETAELPSDIQELILARDEARAAKEYKTSDELRDELEKRGYRVDDGPSGTIVVPLSH